MGYFNKTSRNEFKIGDIGKCAKEATTELAKSTVGTPLHIGKNILTDLADIFIVDPFCSIVGGILSFESASDSERRIEEQRKEREREAEKRFKEENWRLF